jgi:SPP1 gp7 family putative phage head morphogenesis protein
MSKTDPQNNGRRVTKYAAEFRRRIRKVQGDVRGILLATSPQSVFNATADEAVALAELLRRIKAAVDAGLYESEAGDSDVAGIWADGWIKLTYDYAQQRASARFSTPKVLATAPDGFDILAMFGPSAAGVSTKSLEALYVSNRTAVRGLADDVNRMLAEKLTDAFIAREHPYDLANAIASEIPGIAISRAEKIARTELSRAYAESTLDAYEEFGVQGVTGQVEFATAGDNLVCFKCASLSGKVLTVAEARGIIPVHVNCRCDWLPVVLP